jgi:eukaryotic-like serine/threonine-protein kinase
LTVSQELIDAASESLGVVAVKPLKQGGQKTVIEVDQGGTPRVMKVISIGSNAPDALKRAQREVELLKTVNHPNVVKVASDLVELGEPLEGVAWLEELLDGDDLSDVLTTQWDWSDVKGMAVNVAEGLGAMHTVKVVHRDLSANNVRRITTGAFVVMDPGYARHTQASDLTVGGQPGTRGYLSPEHLQAFSGSPTPASDVFCVAILMQKALTGETPIPYTGDESDYLNRLRNVETDDVQTARPDLDQSVVDLIHRCLHPQPARRFRNGADLAKALGGTP